MELSKHNIISKIKDSDEYFIVNALSGNADILSEKTYNDIISGNIESLEMFEKGYVVNATDETALYRKKYLAFLDKRDKDEIQLFFVPNYSCNFDCTYCYQSSYNSEKTSLSTTVIDAFFRYVDLKFSDKRKYITLFGGEPLLNSKKQKELLSYFFKKASDRALEIAIVTNGYNVSEFIDILKEAKIREVQFTLDGTKDFHDKRRFLKGGGGTFENIVKSIDALMALKMPINLRMVVDKDNIGNLPDFAQFVIGKGWTDYPLFKTQMGRNYELHECQSHNNSLFSRIELYESTFELIKKHPHIIKFHQPAFSITRFLFENGEMPQPLFDACTGTKTEWAFDYTGHIYACTATVGKEGESLGTFYPEIILNEAQVEEWEGRDVLSIQDCQSCSVQLICGGGCAAVAKNHNGCLNSPDCRPVKQLLELGMGYYSNLEI